MFENCRILVVGDVMLDRYWFGSTDRVSPEAPVPVIDVEDSQSRPGGAANVAWNLAQLGVSVRLFGTVGDDSAGAELMTLLAARGIGDELVTDADLATTVKQRVVSRNQQLMRLDFGSPRERVASSVGHVLAATVAAVIAAEQVDAVICSDYAKGALAEVNTIIASARAAGVPVVVDPKRVDWAAYRNADVVLPNAAELAAVVEGVDTSDDAAIDRAASDVQQRYGIGALVVTRSQHGMTLAEADGSVSHLQARAREVFDVTGAGDTVTALIAAGLAYGESLPVAAQRANIGAGIVVGRLGTAAPSVAELVAADNPDGPGDDPETKLAWIDSERAAGARIVFTNGCFDLLHTGHIDLLRRARGLGDRLVVALNDDASVARLKGAGRPFQRLATRQTVLAALADVDCVISFEADTPMELIERIRPDVLVKGGDYRPDEVVGAEAVDRAGGRVEILDCVPGYSTTGTVATIRASCDDV